MFEAGGCAYSEFSTPFVCWPALDRTTSNRGIISEQDDPFGLMVGIIPRMLLFDGTDPLVFPLMKSGLPLGIADGGMLQELLMLKGVFASFTVMGSVPFGGV